MSMSRNLLQLYKGATFLVGIFTMLIFDNTRPPEQLPWLQALQILCLVVNGMCALIFLVLTYRLYDEIHHKYGKKSRKRRLLTAVLAPVPAAVLVLMIIAHTLPAIIRGLVAGAVVVVLLRLPLQNIEFTQEYKTGGKKP